MRLWLRVHADDDDQRNKAVVKDDFGEKEKGNCARSSWKSQQGYMNTAQATMVARQRDQIGFGGKEVDTAQNGLPKRLKKESILKKGPKQIGKRISTKRKSVHFGNGKRPKKIGKGQPNAALVCWSLVTVYLFSFFK